MPEKKTAVFDMNRLGYCTICFARGHILARMTEEKPLSLFGNSLFFRTRNISRLYYYIVIIICIGNTIHCSRSILDIYKLVVGSVCCMLGGRTDLFLVLRKSSRSTRPN